MFKYIYLGHRYIKVMWSLTKLPIIFEVDETFLILQKKSKNHLHIKGFSIAKITNILNNIPHFVKRCLREPRRRQYFCPAPLPTVIKELVFYSIIFSIGNKICVGRYPYLILQIRK